MPRLFVGLDLPDALKRAVGGLAAGLREARWTDEDGLHLTLAFIGEVDPSAQRRIEEVLAGVEAPPLAAFALHGFGSYPLRAPPRVLWIGASPARELGSLARSVRRTLSRAGFAPERRKFHPHVTLARFRRPPAPAALQAYLATCALFRSPTAVVTTFRLFSSVLHPSGARYATEAVFPLTGEPPAAAP